MSITTIVQKDRLRFQPNFLNNKGRNINGNIFETTESEKTAALDSNFPFFKMNTAPTKKKIIAASKCALPINSMIINGLSA